MGSVLSLSPLISDKEFWCFSKELERALGAEIWLLKLDSLSIPDTNSN